MHKGAHLIHPVTSVCFALFFFQLPQEEGKCNCIFLALFAGISVNRNFPLTLIMVATLSFQVVMLQDFYGEKSGNITVCEEFPITLLHFSCAGWKDFKSHFCLAQNQ